jgi:hypothetical protein
MNRIAPLVAIAAVLAFGAAADAQCCYTTYYQPATVYYSAAPATTAYYAAAPTTTYYAAAPTTTYYAAAPTTTYYAAAPTTTYYAAAPATVYYAPRVAYYAPAYYPVRSPFYRGWRW